MNQLTFSKSQQILIQSILKTKILNSAYTDSEFKTLYFYSGISGIEEKEENMSYNLLLQMIYSLSLQQQHLEKLGYSFYTFTKKDIVIIDDIYFFCINPDLIMPINKNKLLVFYKPPVSSQFSSIELKKNISIPFKITYKTIYYSIGVLAIYCLYKKEYVNDLTSLDSIKYTKLYWFLLRCMNEKEERRQLLII
jgi:hypothetical protein